MSLSRHSPARRRRIYRRRRIVALVLLVAVMSGGIYVGSLFNAPIPATAAVLETPPQLTRPAAELAWPDFGAGAVGAVGYPGVLAAHGDQGVVPIASITKIVTALVILDEKPLAAGEPGPDIRFTDKDVDIYYDTIAEDGSAAPVADGLVLSQRQAMEAMLIPSANNYSASLANWAFGSYDDYLAAAGVWLDANSLTETTVVDTSGLSPGSVSSPSDLVDLGKLALANPTIADIVSATSADLPYLGTVVNTNKLLGDRGVDGIKTGTTDEAGACLLFSTDVAVGSETVTVVGVLLGGNTHPELNDSITSLLASVETSFHQVTLVTAGDQFGTYVTEWGQSSAIVSGADASTVVFSDEPIDADLTAETVQVTDAGDEVGQLTFTVDGEKLEIPLVAAESILGPDGSWRLANPDALFN